ncbi:hypothetical protein INT48_003908 [Thamnidium elegans]|uniref:Actin cytoskeleton-regulatory complex protein SLA1 n=1 Tax=Thamnidium elegans TaxID=101142 RepID=A0A8H7SPS4_9FUNG|nr:hypothetical protein INT48_003908 [Thamnidium elegans]
MKYVQVSKALYDYEARTEDELSIRQDDVLYVIDKEDQDWWKAELKQVTGEEQGPIGLVPADYLQEVTPIGRVRAEYDYVAQQEEELSFEEGEEMDLLETDDLDWYLVKLANGQIGLAPSNYVEPIEQSEPQPAIPAAAAAAAAATAVPTTNPPNVVSAPQVSIPPPQVQPILAQQTGGTPREVIADDAQSWNVHEYDAAKKKKKKGKGNLYIGNGMLCYGSETDKSLPVQQYPILDVTKYLFDGKNLHIEVDGSKKAVLDLQASSKSEAKAILVKISDSTRIAQQSATHLSQQQKQMAAPATPIVMSPPPLPVAPIQQEEEEEEEEESNCVPKWGISIYSFQAEGGDELSVEENEQIYVLDYERTDGWWRVQKVDGDTGLVPSSYVQFDDDEEDDTSVDTGAVAGAAAVGTAAAAAAAAHSRMDNVEEIRRKREEEERILHQKRIAQEEERELQRRKDQEERARLEEEAKRRREEEKRREEEERERRKQVQEAAKRAEAARQKQIEEDYRRKEAERKATLARSASTSASKSSSNNNRHENLPKPDTSKIRTWTDRSGSFRVEAQFIDFHNGKLRLHKLNGVKIDVPVEKMCQEDVRWVENHIKNISNQQQEITPSMPPRPAQQPSRPPQKKFNERWDWFDWFMVIGIPMQASLQYASAFKQDKLDDSDIPNLTHKQMKTLGLKEEHVRRVERYIETGQPEDASDEGSNKPKEQSQIEKDEELARKLQREWESSEAGSKGKAARPRPNVSAPKDIHPDLLDFIGTQLTSSDTTSKGKEPEKPQGDLVGFNDDAWAPRSGSSPIVTMSPMKSTPAAPAAPAAPAGPTPEQTKAAEAERKRIAEEEQIQKIQLMNLQRQAQEQQKQLEQLQQLTKQQLELQKQLAMQTGSQQQQHQQQIQMQQVQQQQQRLQQQLAQQPSQLQPSFAVQPQHTAMQPQHTAMQPQHTAMQPQMNIMQSQQTPTGRARPTAGNRLNSDLSLGQWQPNQPAQTGFQQQPAQTGFQQQPMQTGFQQQNNFQQQPQQASWQAQQLQPQMTGFPPGSQAIGQAGYNQPMATATVPLSSILPQPLQPSAAGQQQGGLQRAQTIGVQATGRHWGAATPDNPFGSPTLSPLQAQMTGVQFSTPSPQAFHQSPLQSQPTGYMQPQMTGFQQPSNSIFTPQGSMQYGQSAFPNNQKPW